jgi:hypothetical protein
MNTLPFWTGQCKGETMKSLNLTRIVMGAIVIAGLLFFKPLAYFAGAYDDLCGADGSVFSGKVFVEGC